MSVPRSSATASRASLPRLAVLVGGLAVSAFQPRTVSADAFTVTKTTDSERGTCTPGDCSLREAIEAANTSGVASTITLPAGTYVLSIRKTLTLEVDITITGAGSATTIVDGNQVAGVFDNPGSSAEIDGVTIRRGRESSGVGGGGIHNAGSFIGTDLVLTSNSATNGGQGGGLFNEGTAYLIQSVIQTNTAPTGGGVANTGEIHFLGSFTINGNTSSAEGGGLRNDGSAALDNSNPPVPPGPPTGGGTISSNRGGTSGGGIYNTGDLTLANVALDSNTSTGDGGAMWNNGFSVAITNTTISRSTAGGDGAGLWNDGFMQLTNVTFGANSTRRGSGGAIWTDGYVGLSSSTVAGNSASVGGGTFSVPPFGAVEVQSTILSQNTPANCSGTITPDGNNIDNNIVSDGNNIDSGGSCVPTVPSDLSNTDPLLGPLQSNPPGPAFLQTRAPLSGSPALDAAADCPPPDTDERGVTRPQGRACDIGAVEVVRVSPCGDVNGDGLVNIADSLVIAQFDVGLRSCATVPFAHPENCDVNGDGVCNIGDALRMAQCDVGLVSCSFTCGAFSCP